jgi:hypothetical protein
MGRLRASLLAGGVVLITLAGTTVVAAPASAGVVGSYQIGQDGSFPVGTMTLAKQGAYSDVFANGTTDTGVWHKSLTGGIKIKITASSEELDVGCVLKGTINSTGFSSASDPGKYTCPNAPSGTWYAIKGSGSTPNPPGAPGASGWAHV